MTPVSNLLTAQKALNESGKAELARDLPGAMAAADRAVKALGQWQIDLARELVRMKGEQVDA